MYKITVSWAMAFFISDNLRHARIDFKEYVTSRTSVDFIINDADAIRAEKICKGWKKENECN